MRFWDTSALIPLLVPESTTRLLEREYESDAGIMVWWGTLVECRSAIERRARSRELATDGIARANQRLQRLRELWREVEPSDEVRERAVQLLRSHSLRAADALQLAAAFAAADGHPETLEFVSLDTRLLETARAEGFLIGGWNPAIAR